MLGTKHLREVCKLSQIAIFAICSSLALSQRSHAQENAQPPNVIFILIDDQGWTDLSTRMDSGVPDSMSDYYETPNIDALASESFRFSNGYAPAPICTPSRASLLTGKSPQQLGFTDILESRPGSRRFSDLYAGKKLIGPQPIEGLPEQEKTIAEVISQQVPVDYATAHFGKWHVGGGGPGEHGFEMHDGNTGNHNLNAHAHDPNPKDVYGITGRAIAFMKSQVNSGRPFYMQLSHYANHVPLSAMESTKQKYISKTKGERHTNPVYAALNDNLDESVGRLLESLEKMGIAENTYIIYSSDNGGSMNIRRPVTNNAPLRKGKTWVYEGGIRVPFMISGPGISSGQSDIPVIGWDILPTICGMLSCDGGEPNGVEGGDLMPVVTGGKAEVVRPRGNALYWHFPHYLTRKGTTPHSAVRDGKYKLIKFYHHERVELYDLSQDIGETNNLSESLPDVTQKLEAQLATYLKEIGAGMPIVNEAYKP